MTPILYDVRIVVKLFVRHYTSAAPGYARRGNQLGQICGTALPRASMPSPGSRAGRARGPPVCLHPCLAHHRTKGK